MGAVKQSGFPKGRALWEARSYTRCLGVDTGLTVLSIEQPGRERLYSVTKRKYT